MSINMTDKIKQAREAFQSPCQENMSINLPSVLRSVNWLFFLHFHMVRHIHTHFSLLFGYKTNYDL
jgi:hypothetical protein